MAFLHTAIVYYDNHNYHVYTDSVFILELATVELPN